MGEVTGNTPSLIALISFFIMQLCYYQVSTTSCIKEERESLLKLKASFIDSSNRLASWKGIDCCSWDGVGCNQNNGNVVKLDLRNHWYNFSFVLLSDGVDSSLFELKHLNYLDLSGNSFNYTSIPDRFASMFELRYLNLSLSYFYGHIPHSLGNLTKLLVLDLNNKYSDSHGQINKMQLFVDKFGWISSLSSLEYLDLSGVNVQSKFDIMQVLNTLPYLLSLKLSACGLQNPDHSYVALNHSFVPKIKSLDLSRNMFDGPIPTSLGNFSSLEELDISKNMLSGGIPASFGELWNLKYLYLVENNLDGVIHESFGQLQNLKLFDFFMNDLKGVVSEIHFVNVSRLEIISVGENRGLSFQMQHNWVPPFQLEYFSVRSIKGFGSTKIPRWLETQKEILLLDLFNTSILGPIPTWLRFQKLYLLDLSFNHINGSLPKGIDDQMPNLEELYISNTQISGPLPHSICRLNLVGLGLSNNNLSGTIPSCLMTQKLRLLDLSSNKLSGVFPSPSQNLSSIVLIHLARNRLEGEPLAAMKSCKSLSVLNVEGNQFSGHIPTWVGERLRDLKILNLRGNKFNGTIPSTLWLLPYLHILILADNKLVGNISPNVGNFCASQRTRSMDYGFKCYSESAFFYAFCYVTQVIKSREFNYSYFVLPLMVILDLSKNNLDGHIPSEIATIEVLVGLNLSHNNLSGTIPMEIGRIESLESLDLSFNHLFGTIPYSMSSLNSLGVLKLSNNNLSGRIAREGHLSTFNDASTYEGNPYLCGDPLSVKCPNENQNEPQIKINDFDDHTSNEGEKYEKVWFFIIVMIGYAFGFCGVVGALILKRSWRHAYFQFIDETKGKILVAILLNMERFRR